MLSPMRMTNVALLLLALVLLLPAAEASKVDKALTAKTWIVYDGLAPSGVYVYYDQDMDGHKDPDEKYAAHPVYLPERYESAQLHVHYHGPVPNGASVYDDENRNGRYDSQEDAIRLV